MHRYRWNGRDDDGTIVPDGPYRLRVALRDQGRAPHGAQDDHGGHQAAAAAADVGRARRSSCPAAPPWQGAQRYRGPVDPKPSLGIWRTDRPKPVAVAAQIHATGERP